MQERVTYDKDVQTAEAANEEESLPNKEEEIRQQILREKEAEEEMLAKEKELEEENERLEKELEEEIRGKNGLRSSISILKLLTHVNRTDGGRARQYRY